MSVEEPWSWPDSLGRNAFFYIFYPDQLWLKETLLSCIKVRDDGYIQFYRYPPNIGADNQSRDHISAVILALYINRDWEELKNILDNLPLQLSRRYWQTLDFWLWQKSLKAIINDEKVKFQIFRSLFYLLNLLLFIFVIPFSFILRLILNVKSIKTFPHTKRLIPKWKKWIYEKLIYPYYALYNLSWMIWSLKLQNSVLSQLLSLDLNAQNPVVKRLLLNRKIPKSEFPINIFQWAGKETFFDRDVKRLTPEETKFNDLTKAQLDYHYYEIDEIIQRFNPEVINKIKNNNNLIFY